MIIAIDPGLAKCGVVAFTNSGDLLDADVCTTKPGHKPKGTVGSWSAMDQTRRELELLDFLVTFWRRYSFSDRADDDHRVSAVAIEGIGTARGAHALAQMGIAAGTVVAWSKLELHANELCHTTPLEWRYALGWAGTKIAKGTPKKARAAIKKADDARLYAMLRGLPQGAEVERHLQRRGRNASDHVHALDAFGIGRWYLQRESNSNSRSHARAA